MLAWLPPPAMVRNCLEMVEAGPDAEELAEEDADARLAAMASMCRAVLELHERVAGPADQVTGAGTASP